MQGIFLVARPCPSPQHSDGLLRVLLAPPLPCRMCSVVDVRVGTTEEQSNPSHYRFGPTRFSVIPKAAVGKVSIRFVPDQARFRGRAGGGCRERRLVAAAWRARGSYT